MEKSEKSITLRQLILILFVAGGASKLIIMPLILLKIGGRSAIISLALFLAVDFIQLLILVFTSSIAKDKSLVEIVEQSAGKTAAHIMTAIIFAYATIKALFLLEFFKSFITSSLFENVMWSVYALPLIIILVSFGQRSLKSTGRLCEILFIFIIVSLILLFYLISKNSSPIALLPIGGDGNALDTFLKMPLWFGDYILAALFLGKVKTDKPYRAALLWGGAITAAIIFIASAIIFSAYADIAQYFDYNRKLSSITQITISGINAGRYDKLLFCIAMSGAVITLGLYFYFAVRSGEYTIGIKKPCPHTSWGLAIALYILTCFIFINDGITLQYATKYANWFSLGVQIFVPLLLLAAAIWGRKKPAAVREVKPI